MDIIAEISPQQCVGAPSCEEGSQSVSSQDQEQVSVQMDNMTVFNYINKWGGTRSPQLCKVTCDLRNWCIIYRIQLQAVHITGVHNTPASSFHTQSGI